MSQSFKETVRRLSVVPAVPPEKQRSRIAQERRFFQNRVEGRGLSLLGALPECPESMTLEEVARGRWMFRIYSELFGEEILLVPDRYVSRPGGPVCYTAEEAACLLLAEHEDDLLSMHARKKRGLSC